MEHSDTKKTLLPIYRDSLNFFQVPCVQSSSNPVARWSSPPCFAKCVINIQSSTIKNTKTPSEGATIYDMLS